MLRTSGATCHHICRDGQVEDEPLKVLKRMPLGSDCSWKNDVLCRDINDIESYRNFAPDIHTGEHLVLIASWFAPRITAEIGKPVHTLGVIQTQTVKRMCKLVKTYSKGKSSEDFKFYVVQRGRTTHEVRREN